jgi:hypothetical protein
MTVVISDIVLVGAFAVVAAGCLLLVLALIRVGSSGKTGGQG